MDPARRAFYEFHSTFMEPWDGPACVTFTDGTLIGAVLDRNGLRPGRYWVTDDGLVVLASEAGVLDIEPERGRPQGPAAAGPDVPRRHRSTGGSSATRRSSPRSPPSTPTRSGCTPGCIEPRATCPSASTSSTPPASVARRQQTFGYTEEELQDPARPDGQHRRRGARLDGHRHPDRGAVRPAAAALRLLHPALRPGDQPAARRHPRGAGHLARHGRSAPRATSLDADPGARPPGRAAVPGHRQRRARQDRAHQRRRRPARLRHRTSCAGLYDVTGGEAALRARLDEIFAEVSAAIADGARFVVLSDRDSDRDLAPIPSLLLTSAVHHHLIREKTRTQVGLLVEAGDVREVHHVALLVGYGAAAINPYLAMETVEDLVRTGAITGVTAEKAVAQPHQGARQGRAQGDVQDGHLDRRLLPRRPGLRGDRPVAGPRRRATSPARVSQLGGIGLDVIAAEVAARHAAAYPPDGIRPAHRKLRVGGEYQWRREGELHLFDPETVFRLQHATRARRYDVFKQYTARVDEQSERLMTLRGLFELGGDRAAPPVPIEEVEPVSEIVKRFTTGAMSYGSISQEAHETLAIAMNRLGGRSNTGEGGEDAERLLDPRAPLGDQAGRVRPLRRDLAVPHPRRRHPDQDGAGRQARRGRPAARPQGLPVDRQDPALHARASASSPRRRTTTSTPSRTSPSSSTTSRTPTPQARIHVKLVSEVGVGTVAAGVSKAHADVVLISGHDGGTGASPLTSPQARRRAVGARPRRDPADAACSTACATGSSCRSTASSRPAATSSSPRCSAPRSSASPPPRSSCPAAS